jgi:hypothetical protein
LTEVGEVFFESFEGILAVAFAHGEVVVVVSNFMAHCCYLIDNMLVDLILENAKIVAAFDAEAFFYSSHAEGIGIAGFDIVAENDER